MDPHTRTERYGKHDLTVRAYEVRRGVFRWNYLVDGTIEGHSSVKAACPTAEMALQRAMNAAKLRADELG
jgi:hypothetical protein